MSWKVLENVEQSKIGRELSRGHKWGLKGQGGGRTGREELRQPNVANLGWLLQLLIATGKG